MGDFTPALSIQYVVGCHPAAKVVLPRYGRDGSKGAAPPREPVARFRRGHGHTGRTAAEAYEQEEPPSASISSPFRKRTSGSATSLFSCAKRPSAHPIPSPCARPPTSEEQRKELLKGCLPKRCPPWDPGSASNFAIRGEAKFLPAVGPVPEREIKTEDGHVYVALDSRRVKVGAKVDTTYAMKEIPPVRLLPDADEIRIHSQIYYINSNITRGEDGDTEEVRAMSVAIHTLHVVLAGAWLGTVVFTTAVVSPAFKAMKWTEPERVGVRSVVGRHYARVAGVNLALLLVFATLDGVLMGIGPVFFAEYALLAVLFGLAGAHGAYFGRKLAALAEAERAAGSAEEAGSFARQRRALGWISLWVSRLNGLVSVVVAVLAVNG